MVGLNFVWAFEIREVGKPIDVPYVCMWIHFAGDCSTRLMLVKKLGERDIRNGQVMQENHSLILCQNPPEKQVAQLLVQ